MGLIKEKKFRIGSPKTTDSEPVIENTRKTITSCFKSLTLKILISLFTIYNFQFLFEDINQITSEFLVLIQSVDALFFSK